MKFAGFKPEMHGGGSGLGGITQGVTKPVVIPYTDIPHFPKPTVAGHAGQMIFGELAGKKLMVLSGRFHRYEGRSPAEITYPIHVVDALGVKMLIVTNAAGGINPQYKPGDLMVIEDHINHMGINPLIGGVNGDGGVKFIDMTQAYSPRLREKLDAAAEKQQVPIWRGVYLATTGTELRDARRDQGVRLDRRGCRRHEHRARSHHGALPQYRGRRHLLHHEPRRRHLQ